MKGKPDKFRSGKGSNNSNLMCLSLTCAMTILLIVVAYINFSHIPIVSVNNNTFGKTIINKDQYQSTLRQGIETGAGHKSTTSVITTTKKTLISNYKNQKLNLHFIHIPKCGGTSMTAVLRHITCQINQTKNQDCCTNPGFCDWWAHRRCAAIKGCTDHFPHTSFIFKENIPTIAIFRNPVSRLLSAWFYRCHTPNNDCFQVRPYFKLIHEGKLPKVDFDEYIEMNEYQNIQTRMLGADSFPYRNISIDDKVYAQAVNALNHIFFIGLQEAYDISVELLLRELDMSDLKSSIVIKNERDQASANLHQEKKTLQENKLLMSRVEQTNAYDIKLYKLAVIKFCSTVKKYPDLIERVRAEGKVECL